MKSFRTTALLYQLMLIFYNTLLINSASSTLNPSKFSQLQNKFSSFTNRFGTFNYRWQAQGEKGPAVLFIHGFGGNADQFRKNIPALAAAGYRCYAVDLLGYGYSDKPNPRNYPVNELYNFENWSEQICSFIESEVKEPCTIVTNSVGGLVGLQTASTRPDLAKGVVLMNISLRLLHAKKQNPLQRPIVSAIQYVLRESGVGKAFFSQVATKKALQNILSQAYAEKVSEEVVELILQPGLDPGAPDVFLDFISYSGGPLPEELLERMPADMPVRILWGENDPWEPIELGRALSVYPCVDQFVPMPGGGHCPMDQIPDTVNSELLRFLADKGHLPLH